MSESALATRPSHEWDFLAWEDEFRPDTSAVRAVLTAAEVLDEEACRLKAGALIRTAGALALTGYGEREPAKKGETQNLLEAVKAAKEGDANAAKLIATNIITDIYERTVKAGFVMSVELGMDGQGRIMQNGQTNEQIQMNTLRYLGGNSKMQPRFEAEVRNMYRLQFAKDEGLLEDYCFVVISRCPDDMTDAELEDAGYFKYTKSMAVQATSISGGTIVTESAFVAGVRNQGADRHDAETVAQFGEKLGIQLDGSATQTLDTPFLVPKWVVPNGVVDIVKLLDHAAGGTFFGENKPSQDYAAFREKCRRSIQDMQPTARKIQTDLMRSADTLRTPLEATRLLNTLSQKYTLEQAIITPHIDARVYGMEAAFHIEAARAYYLQGNMERVSIAKELAHSVAKSSSCPAGGSAVSSPDSNPKEESWNGIAEDISRDNEGDCEYISKKCPKCGARNVLTTDKKVRGNIRRISGKCGCSVIYTK